MRRIERVRSKDGGRTEDVMAIGKKERNEAAVARYL
jgi:hypothetical protein